MDQGDVEMEKSEDTADHIEEELAKLRTRIAEW